MIPILYPSTETAFSANGIGRLVDALSCSVTEERNGIYELEMTYPITGKRFSEIEIGCYIGAIHDDNHDIQPFQVYKISAPLNGVVTFYAHHISYQLSNVILQPYSATSCADLFNKMAVNAANNCPFDFWTDKAVNTPYTIDHPVAVRQILGGTEGSILDVYGKGEYEFDKFHVKLYVNRGTSTGATIRYGKNLTSLKKDLDASGTYGAVAPFWKGDGGIVYLTDGLIVYKEQGATAVPLDLSEKFDSMPTEVELKQAAQDFLDNNEPWIPDENISIDFLQLWQTSEYDDYAALQRVGLCDKVSVIYAALGVVAENQEVIKVVYDTLGEYYTKMELGKLQTNLYQAISQSTKESIDYVSPGAMQAAIDHATDMLSGGLGGYVVFGRNADGQIQEIYVMDTPDALTANSVIRINKNGIGFSSTGINGDYTTAWTIDGHFLASVIDTGVLDAQVIKGGILAAANDPSKFSLNMETGDLSMDINSVEFSGNSLSVVIANETAGIADDLSDLRSHIVIDTTEGFMQFIAENTNPITLKIEKDANNNYQLAIYNGDTAIDTFGAGGTNTENLVIPDDGSFTQGPFKWITHSDKRQDLVWVG